MRFTSVVSRIHNTGKVNKKIAESRLISKLGYSGNTDDMYELKDQIPILGLWRLRPLRSTGKDSVSRGIGCHLGLPKRSAPICFLISRIWPVVPFGGDTQQRITICWAQSLSIFHFASKASDKGGFLSQMVKAGCLPLSLSLRRA